MILSDTGGKETRSGAEAHAKVCLRSCRHDSSVLMMDVAGLDAGTE